MFKKLANGVGNVCLKVAGVVKSGCAKMALIAGGIFACVASSQAAQDFSPVAKDATTGDISFTPENLTSPLADAVIQGYSSWAVIALIIAGVGLVCWIIFRRKG